MPDRDDLLPEDGEPTAESATGSPASSPSADGTTDNADQGVGAGEIRVVEAPTQQRVLPTLLLAFLLICGVAGAGYYWLSSSLPGWSESLTEPQSVQPVKRYPIDRDVKVEVLAQEQVAAVEIQTATAVGHGKPRQPEAASPARENIQSAGDDQQQTETVTGKPAAAPYQALVGPFLNKSATDRAAEQLRALGFTAEPTKGRGVVAMTRLLEGIYPEDSARERLQELKQQIGDAFMMPAGDKLAIYVGSFGDLKRAEEYARQLAEQGVAVTPIETEVELNGRMLVALRGTRQAVQQAAEKLESAGFRSQVKER